MIANNLPLLIVTYFLVLYREVLLSFPLFGGEIFTWLVLISVQLLRNLIVSVETV